MDPQVSIYGLFLLPDFSGISPLILTYKKCQKSRQGLKVLTEFLVDSLTAMDWFDENIDRTEAEELLRDDGRDGSFIVRISKAGQSGSKTSPYSLSVYRAQKYYHFKIMLTGPIDQPVDGPRRPGPSTEGTDVGRSADR